MKILLLLLTTLVGSALSSTFKNVSVTYDQQTKKFTLHDYIADNSVAYGNFKDEIFKTG